MAQGIAGHFPLEATRDPASATAGASFLEDFLQDTIQPLGRQRRGERLAGGPVCVARPARYG